MHVEPSTKRTVAYYDGQNLYHSARKAFGHKYPNYDPLKLAERICADQGWLLQQVRFYTGLHASGYDSFWHQFWTSKLGAMGHRGIIVFSRPLRYRKRKVLLPNGTFHSFRAGEEKGIDVRIALDIIRMTRKNELDVALVFSQDQDFSEVAAEIRVLAQEQDRWIKIASAFPVSPATANHRGINDTDWIKISKATYDTCLDMRDYRPKGIGRTP